MQFRHDQNAEALWGFAKPRSYRFHSQVHQGHGRVAPKHTIIAPWQIALHISGGNHHRQRNHCKSSVASQSESGRRRQCRHPVKNRRELESSRSPKKSLICVLAMRIAIPFGEPTINRARKIFHRCTHSVIPAAPASPGHHGARKQSVNAVLCDDSGDYNHEPPVGPPIWRL